MGLWGFVFLENFFRAKLSAFGTVYHMALQEHLGVKAGAELAGAGGRERELEVWEEEAARKDGELERSGGEVRVRSQGSSHTGGPGIPGGPLGPRRPRGPCNRVREIHGMCG